MSVFFYRENERITNFFILSHTIFLNIHIIYCLNFADCVPGKQRFRSQRTGDATSSTTHWKSGRDIHSELLSWRVRKSTWANSIGVSQVQQHVCRPHHSPRDVSGRVQRYLGWKEVQGLTGADSAILRM